LLQAKQPVPFIVNEKDRRAKLEWQAIHQAWEGGSMSDLSNCNPTGRFSGLSDLYAKYRPSYPDAALDLIMTRGRLGPASLLVDVGCGTGISSRLFALRAVPVVGIEPNADMRSRAEAEPLPPDVPRPKYCEGRAEATGLADGVAEVVLAAQAFHWFQPGPTLAEFQRILKPDGWVALLGNERDESDLFTTAYGAVIRTCPDAAKVEGPRARAGDALLVSDRFQDAERVSFVNEQQMDEDGLLGRTMSASYVVREGEAGRVFVQAVRDVFARFQQNGQVVLRYETAVYLARRR
jgi:SAM-dependent methyltransferase